MLLSYLEKTVQLFIYILYVFLCKGFENVYQLCVNNTCAGNEMVTKVCFKEAYSLVGQTGAMQSPDITR